MKVQASVKKKFLNFKIIKIHEKIFVICENPHNKKRQC